jgi:type IV secretory pathway VirB10-like protein
MTDELTPEEKEALKSLPRERMPAGLEGRVVNAMREHGFLEKPRRVIAVTNSRLAGLLAACVALMIGAYSIGLHRGGGEQVLPTVTTTEQDRLAREEPVASEPEKKAHETLSDEATEAPTPTPPPETAPVKQKEEPPAPQVKEEPPAPEEKAPAPKAQAEADQVTHKKTLDVQVDEEAVVNDRQVAAQEEGQAVVRDKALAATGRETTTSQPQEKTAPRAMFSDLSKGALTFMLNGRPVVVEAPDSVRVVEDRRGRMLLIYTSDGVIRIRLPDDN